MYSLSLCPNVNITNFPATINVIESLALEDSCRGLSPDPNTNTINLIIKAQKIESNAFKGYCSSSSGKIFIETTHESIDGWGFDSEKVSFETVLS